MLISLCFAIGLFFVTCESQKSFQCNNSGKDKMDETARWLFFFGDPYRKLPESDSEREKFCRDKTQKEKFMKDYPKKCLKAFPLQVTNLLMYGVVKKNKYYCSNKKGKQDIIKVGKCLNSIKTKGNKCMKDLIDSALGTFHAPIKIKMELVCCNYYKFEECINREATDAGTDKCPEATVNLVDQLMEGYTGDMLALICSEYPRYTDKCAKVLPQTPKAKPDQPQSKSILPPFIDVLQSIPA